MRDSALEIEPFHHVNRPGLEAVEAELLAAARKLRAAVAQLEGVDHALQQRVFRIHTEVTKILNEIRS